VIIALVAALLLLRHELRIRRRAVAAEAAARAAAEQRLRDRAGLCATVAHEIRNPLTVIIGWVELLPMRAPDDLQPVRAIRQSAEDVTRLLDDLLALSRFDAGGGAMAPRPEPVAIAAWLNALVERHLPRATERGLSLTVDVAATLPERLRIDPGRLAQAVGNLVVNAVKYTRDGQVTVRAAWAADRLHLSVADTGPGVPSDQRARLFDPFFQRDGQSTALGGSGLGLAVVRRLAQAMDGDVTLDCPATGGAVFTIEIAAPVA
jgi:two-component system capsular synthesis sensor histidine kinase RcsC